MVGSFLKVFFGILSILVVQSDGLECFLQMDDIKRPIAGFAATLAENAGGIKLYAAQQKSCPGYCTRIKGNSTTASGRTENFDMAGCQPRLPSLYEDLGHERSVILYSYRDDSDEGGFQLEVTVFICNVDNCNSDTVNHKKMDEIRTAVKKGELTLKGNRSEQLKCHNFRRDSVACQGSCNMIYPENIDEPLISTCEPVRSTTNYEVTVVAAWGSTKDKDNKIHEESSNVFVVAKCTTNNCNAYESIGSEYIQNISQTARNVITGSVGRYKLLLPILVTMIITLLICNNY